MRVSLSKKALGRVREREEPTIIDPFSPSANSYNFEQGQCKKPLQRAWSRVDAFTGIYIERLFIPELF
jgi:hypothetical protein